MYYVFLFTLSMLLVGCFEKVGTEPITSANGLTFMSSRMPSHSSGAGVSDTLASSNVEPRECVVDHPAPYSILPEQP